MTANGYLQIALYLVVLLALAKPLGGTWRGSTRASRSASTACSGRSSG